MKFIYPYILLILLFLFTNCEEQITLQTEEGSKKLVVEGLILDNDGSYVRLFNSAAYNSVFKGGDAIPVTGATVTISDNIGDTYFFYETQPGTYQDTEYPNKFRGVIGRSYKLYIKTPEGKEYESKMQRLNEKAHFDSLYYLTKKKERVNEFNKIITENGKQIFSTFQFAPTSQYLRWGWSYTKTTSLGIDFENTKEIINVQDFNFVNVSNAFDFNSESINEYEILFLKETQKIAHYKMTVKLYNINKEAFQFWEAIKKQQTSVGSIFDPIPSQINGNIYNINNPDDTVFGFFSTASIVEREIEFIL